MNYSIFECLHKKIKKFDKNFNICISCKKRICKHPPEYISIIQPDRYTQELINSMPYKKGLFIEYYCKLCGDNVVNNNGWN